ncbi:MAG: L-threonylcarbamoyladenylate synthase [Candidatus Nanoarchaeia archaeon]|nr:L-threonylcarbamoyladenylate synthase [Candidatus Nanoarchaeia archaeon]
MDTYYIKDFETKSQEIIDRINKGDVFVYPTDTIYGIGCDATNPQSVERIREIKQRFQGPFSVIAPNKEWIKNNCKTDTKINFWIKKLPGPYTFILNLKNENTVTKGVEKDMKLGIRILNHKIMEIFEKTKKPIITTSVNISTMPPLKDPKKISQFIEKNIDFIINQGLINSEPSNIIDLTQEKPNIIR